jgi:hypothetical protein
MLSKRGGDAGDILFSKHLKLLEVLLMQLRRRAILSFQQAERNNMQAISELSS